jgi:hypothetical protein
MTLTHIDLAWHAHFAEYGLFVDAAASTDTRSNCDFERFTVREAVDFKMGMTAS